MAFATLCGLLFIYGTRSQSTTQEPDSCNDREVFCLPGAEENSTVEHDIDLPADSKWQEPQDTATTNLAWMTDGYIVTLTGKVLWTPTDLVMGNNPGDAIIGEIDAGYCPTYPAIFSVTNQFGLHCTIEITQSVENKAGVPQPCDIILKSWSISLLYYQTVPTPTSSSGVFWYVDSIQQYFGQNPNPADLKLRYMNGTEPSTDVKELQDISELNLDGITYVRAKALTFMYTPPNGTVTRRRRLAADVDHMRQIAEEWHGWPAEGKEKGIDVNDFLSSLPASTIFFSGFCIAFNAFVLQFAFQWLNQKG